MTWLHEETDRENLLLMARQDGRDLRAQHYQNEKNVLDGINNEIVKEKKRQSSTSTKTKRVMQESEQNVQIVFPQYQFTINEYVAVVYLDTSSWCPRLVDSKKDSECAIVKFMTPCHKSGILQWLVRDKIQTVKGKIVLSRICQFGKAVVY